MLASCKKMDSNVSSPSSQLSPQLVNTTNMIDLGQDEANVELSDLTDNDVSAATGSVDCKTVTYSPSKDVYPHIKTVDYGSGCVVAPGKTVSGKRISTVYADKNTATAGTLISVTSYSNYYVNGLNISGSSTTYADDNATANTMAFKVIATKTFTDQDGTTSTYIDTRHSVQIDGNSTPSDNTDDVYQVTGTSTGTELDPSGTVTMAVWRATIEDNHPVIKEAGCQFRTQGILDIRINQNGASSNETLDYGNGNCDNKATLIVDNGSPEEVTLPFVFYAAHL